MKTLILGLLMSTSAFALSEYSTYENLPRFDFTLNSDATPQDMLKCKNDYSEQLATLKKLGLTIILERPCVYIGDSGVVGQIYFIK